MKVSSFIFCVAAATIPYLAMAGENTNIPNCNIGVWYTHKNQDTVSIPKGVEVIVYERNRSSEEANYKRCFTSSEMIVDISLMPDGKKLVYNLNNGQAVLSPHTRAPFVFDELVEIK